MTDRTQEFFDEQDAEALVDANGVAKRSQLNGAGHGHSGSWREIELIHFDEVEPKLDQQWLIRGLIQPEQITVAFWPTGLRQNLSVS